MDEYKVQQETAAVGEKQIQDMLALLMKYKNGKQSVDNRLVSAENWWKLRNDVEEAKEGHDKQGFRSKSGWLHNVLVNKHADCMEAYPEPNILPREQGDKAEAEKLSKIIPCVLEQNLFEATYSENMWRKVKFGTAVYKVIWDKTKLNGLGDIGITPVNILNLFWEPGITDIQKSKYVFEVDFRDEDDVREMFPQLGDKAIPKDVITSKFKLDDRVDDTDKVPVISAYYHKGGKLHYCLFVPGTVLYATENDTERPAMQKTDPVTGVPVKVETGEPSGAERGWYDHGKYPYVFDVLFPVEGSPCGYGYVDLCRQPQTEIDLLKTAYVENAMVGAKPRYFSRANSGINKEQFLDVNEPFVHVDGSLDDTGIRPIDHDNLDGNYINMLQLSIEELRETSGNTEAATGSTPSGVTSASGIAALQEASGKGSRDNNMGAYRCYAEICSLCIELIRQFYDIPRQFRIIGEDGEDEFTSYSNQGLQPVPLSVGGIDMGYRLPVFDIKIQPQRRSAYTKMSNNDLALQFYNLGFFNPQMTDQALACLSMMDFDSIEEVRKIVKRNGDIFERYQMVIQIAAMLANECGDANAMAQLQMLSQQTGMALAAQAQTAEMPKETAKEHPFVEKARMQAQEAAQPTEGKMA